MDLYELSCAVEDYVITMRREFHSHPEISFEEIRTTLRIKEELEKAEKAGLSKTLEMYRSSAKASSEDVVTAPAPEPCTASIPGIEVMDLEDAVQTLWKAGIYAESGMGCTGPLVMMSENNYSKSVEILKKAGYIG